MWREEVPLGHGVGRGNRLGQCTGDAVHQQPAEDRSKAYTQGEKSPGHQTRRVVARDRRVILLLGHILRRVEILRLFMRIPVS